MCPRRHWLYSRLTFCIPTSLSQLIKIAEFLIKTERKICINTQNILFDGVIYCLRSIYTRKYIFLYPETGPRNRPKFLKKVLRRGKLLIKNKHFAWIIKQLLNMAFWRTSIGRKVFSLLIYMPWQYQICIAKCLYSYRNDLPQNLGETTAHRECTTSTPLLELYNNSKWMHSTGHSQLAN